MKLMTHVVAGYPDFSVTEELMKVLDSYSAYIEIQIPYSDPVADGPVIMEASEKVLSRGVRVQDVFDFTKKITPDLSAKVLFMTYGNIVYQYGVRAFIDAAIDAGVFGCIIPDVSPENFSEFYTYAREKNFRILPIFAPTSSQERMKMLGELSPELIYAVARTGITGADTEFGQEVAEFIDRMRSVYGGEIAMGFGITSKDHIDFLRGKIEYPVIGSQIIRELQLGGCAGVEKFLKKIMGE